METRAMDAGETAGGGRFDGVRQIIRYNWPQYAAGIAAATAAFIVIEYLPANRTVKTIAAGAGLLAGYWTIASLVASWWVYDRARITDCGWLVEVLVQRPARWVNIHAGLDQTTPALIRAFPSDAWCVLDIYDSKRMTEPSIVKARRVAAANYKPTPASIEKLPLESESIDALFLIFAAHEIRAAPDRERFMREAERILRPGGQLVIVEHVRDVANFAAFGPGFFHFLAAGEWSRLVRLVGMTMIRHERRTPFVRVFVAEKRGSC